MLNNNQDIIIENLLYSYEIVQKILRSAITASVYVVFGTQQYMQIKNEIAGMAGVRIPIEKKGGDGREGYAYYLYCRFSPKYDLHQRQTDGEHYIQNIQENIHQCVN